MSLDDLRDRKRALRQQLRSALRALDPEVFAAAGRAVVQPLVDFARGAQAVALFASRAWEIDTGPFDEALRGAGVSRATPRIEGDALVFTLVPHALPLASLPRDRLGIPTPDARWPTLALARAVVVVPGLAFDARGGRLGHGRGFYDRALRDAALERCVGLCLDDQLVPEVPTEPHDVRVARICTPLRGVFRAHD